MTASAVIETVSSRSTSRLVCEFTSEETGTLRFGRDPIVADTIGQARCRARWLLLRPAWFVEPDDEKFGGKGCTVADSGLTRQRELADTSLPFGVDRRTRAHVSNPLRIRRYAPCSCVRNRVT